MIKIGDFSKIFNISIKTIRFYEEKGLIHPSYVDIYSSYRYYDDNNIDEMSKILYLKELGFSLEEIKNFNDEKITNKIKEYKNKIEELNKNINTLEFLSNDEEEYNMKTFINDEKTIGKWKLSKIYDTKEDYLNNVLSSEKFNIENIYFLPKGEEYWIFKWTKGILYINNNACKYEIKNNNMFISYCINNNSVLYLVYEKIDSKNYTKEDLYIKDNIDIEYVLDNEIKGLWKSVDYVNNIDQFNYNRKNSNEKELYVKSISIFNDYNVLINYNDNKNSETKYTKNYLLEFCAPYTKSKYEIKNINDKTYMIVEWKSGDYVYGGLINGYYVFEKVE